MGDAFRIDDDGEPQKEVLIEHINTENGEVTTLDGALHGFETGDSVQFEDCSYLNGPIKITVKSTLYPFLYDKLIIIFQLGTSLISAMLHKTLKMLKVVVQSK